MAVRPPINTPAAAAANAAAEPITAESLGWQLRAALPPLRLHSVSLYDEQANVLWLSEGALGPDEHNVVLDAMEQLSNDKSLPCYENGLEDGRVGIFLPVRAPQGDLVGVAMILADLKSVGDGVLEKIVSPPVRTIMQKVAVLLRASTARPSEAPAPIPVAGAPALELAPDRAPSPARAASPAALPAAPASVQPAPAKATAAAPAKPATNTKVNGSHTPVVANMAPAAPAAASGRAASAAAPSPDPQSLSPQAIDDILEFELFPNMGASSEEEVPKSPASSFLAESLAWNPGGSDYEMMSEAAPPVLQSEPPKPAPVTQPARAAAPAVAAKAAAPSSRSAAPAQLASPAQVAAPSPAVASAPVAAASVAQVAPVAQPAPATFSSFDLSLPAELLSPAATPASLAQAAAATASPSAIVVPNVPTLQAPDSAPIIIPTPTPAAAPKSTGATTTTKALGNGTTTGTAKSLNGATSIVQSLNGTSATITSRTIALDPSSLILDVQPFSKLRPGGRMRRYEVLPRIPHRDANRAPAAMDGLALQRLLSWLGANRSAWNLEPTSFSLNLSISTLEDERFPQQVAQSLKANGIAPDNLGFEIAEPLCTQRRAQVERFISLCDKLGCFVVIDDFSFDSSMLPLLRSKALRLVKIDPKLTSAALRDKLSQAVVVAIVQAVKVLGIHCAAKRVESQASLQWLTAIGCDLAQGPALSQVLPIESLNMPAAPAAEAGKAS
jgi:EAL domain-containing protein (putative c-di-GMP-specific phosphodiesterase class I)